MVPFLVGRSTWSITREWKRRGAATHRSDAELQATGTHCSLEEAQSFSTSSTLFTLFPVCKLPYVVQKNIYKNGGCQAPIKADTDVNLLTVFAVWVALASASTLKWFHGTSGKQQRSTIHRQTLKSHDWNVIVSAWPHLEVGSHCVWILARCKCNPYNLLASIQNITLI